MRLCCPGWVTVILVLTDSQPGCLMDCRLFRMQQLVCMLEFPGTPLLRELHWLKVPYQITYKLCTLVFRCLHGTAPPYLADHCILLTDLSSRRSRNRSAAVGDLLIPRSS